MALEQLRLFANGAQEWRPAGSDEATVADVFVSHRYKRTGFDVTLGVYVERRPSCPRAAILPAVFIIGELTEDNRLAASELEDTITERGSCRFIQDPVGPGVWSTGYVFSEESNDTANGYHLVDKLIGGELGGIGSGVCRDEAKEGLGFTEVGEGTQGSLMGAGLAALVGVAGKFLDAHERDDVSAPDDATGNVGRYERAIGDE